MKLLRVLGVICFCLTLASGMAIADYQPGHDLIVPVNAAPSLLNFDGSTGAASFALQEGAHTAITNSSGQSVDHFYVWVYVNGQPVLAVDPCWVDYRR
jgi:hypothetical protein